MRRCDRRRLCPPIVRVMPVGIDTEQVQRLGQRSRFVGVRGLRVARRIGKLRLGSGDLSARCSGGVRRTSLGRDVMRGRDRGFAGTHRTGRSGGRRRHGGSSGNQCLGARGPRGRCCGTRLRPGLRPLDHPRPASRPSSSASPHRGSERAVHATLSPRRVPAAASRPLGRAAAGFGSARRAAPADSDRPTPRPRRGFPAARQSVCRRARASSSSIPWTAYLTLKVANPLASTSPPQNTAPSLVMRLSPRRPHVPHGRRRSPAAAPKCARPPADGRSGRADYARPRPRPVAPPAARADENSAALPPRARACGATPPPLRRCARAEMILPGHPRVSETKPPRVGPPASAAAQPPPIRGPIRPIRR